MVLLDLAHVAQFEHAAGVGAAHRGAAHPTTRSRGETCAAASASRNAAQHRFGRGALIGDAALYPAMRLRRAASQKAHRFAIQQEDDEPRAPAAGVESYSVDRFCCHT